MLRRILFAPIHRRQLDLRFKSSGQGDEEGADLRIYHDTSNETLEALSDRLEDVLEDRYDRGADVSLNNGVLTVVVDQDNTYVINKQTPNRQIWLSSPISGPKRFDLMSGNWVEKNSKVELRKLLSEELSALLKNQVNC